MDPHMKVSVEPARLFGWAHNRRMVHQYATDSPEQHSLGFELIFFFFLHRLSFQG